MLVPSEVPFIASSYLDNQVDYIRKTTRLSFGYYRRMTAPSRGAELALLLLGGFETMVDEVVAGLEERGHPGVSAMHEFALRAIDTGADSASELGRRLSVSKQAAAKTIAVLETLGYVARKPDSNDGRRKRLQVTRRGREMVAIGAALFDDVRDRWAREIGEKQLRAIESHLAIVVSASTISAPGLSEADNVPGS
jgi:DNA-binding MarR family transcriptional regulator